MGVEVLGVNNTNKNLKKAIPSQISVSECIHTSKFLGFAKTLLFQKNKVRGQGVVEYILVLAVIISIGILIYRVAEQRMVPILVKIRQSVEQSAQWGGRQSVDQYYINGGAPYSDAQVRVDQGY